MAFVGNTILLF
jgi:hypothetical protein